MNKELKNVLSKTEPSNTNVVWYQPTEGGIIPKVFRGGWQALIQGAAGDNTQVIEWSHTHNMNDYKEAGTYRIKGERTGSPMDDNLPIMNSGSGHTIDGILYVLDSSLPTGGVSQDDKCVTQFLMLSNRVGGQEGDMYMRSGYGLYKSDDAFNWKPWEKYQTNMEVGAVSDDATHDATTLAPINSNGLKTFVDNGVYSGVYLTQEALNGDSTKAQTFVMVVINNYAVAGDNTTITQIKFAVTNAGEYSIERRRRDFDGKWSGWINEYNDLYTRIDEIEKEIATKQQELTLTVLDNGNIRIGNLQGQTKDFMQATPSGDPMHYAYIDAGAEWNDTDKDIVKSITIPSWQNYGEYITEDVVHKSKCYRVGTCGDLTSSDMAVIYNDDKWWLSENCAGISPTGRCLLVPKSFIYYYYKTYDFLQAFSENKVMQDVWLTPRVVNTNKQFPLKVSGFTWFGQGSFFRRIIGVIDFSGISRAQNMNFNPSRLEYINIIKLMVSLNIQWSVNISKDSIKYMIVNAVPTTAITITLHPDAYVRIANQPDIIESLETKNAALASTGGSISLVSA